MSAITKQEVLAVIETVKTIGMAIKELGSVPSGHLYAQLCGHMSLETYNFCISKLKEAKVIEEKNYLLTWIAKK